ncbi:hypothetical protein M434DRAFT_397938 [Hypoxylon sp. CO27-5]|nr:hypothetical protein M434DRAFT_397938 [Hypoxylon sp. CO27-5]
MCYDRDFNAKATTCISANCTIPEALFTKNLTSTSCGITSGTNHSFIPIDITFFTVAAISVFLRAIARYLARVPVWWDDFTIILAFLCCIAYTTIALIILPRGLGTDIWAIPLDTIILIFKALYTLYILYITGRHLVRMSILFFYLRIFSHIPLARRLIRLTILFFIACCIAFDFAIMFGCAPFDYYWTMWDGQHEGHCISINAIFWSGAIIVIAMDFWVILIPLPFIVRMNLPLRKKITTGIMFALGILVIIISLYRLRTINQFTQSQNPTLDFLEVGIWSGLENYVGITCACLPNFHYLRKPVNAWLNRLSYHKTRSSGPTDGRSGIGSGHPGSLDNTKFGSDRTTTTATTVDVERHASESQVQLSRPGWSDIAGSVDIELDTRNRLGTGRTAWS